jgi:hypothetical protein
MQVTPTIIHAITTAMLIHVLDDLKGGVEARGFGDGFHKGIVSLMIQAENPKSSPRL